MMGLCQAEGIGVIPWSPLARGKLARPWETEPSTKRADTDQFGKTLYSKMEDTDRKVIEAVGTLAEARGVPRAQIALAWLLSKPGVTSPIVGATKPHHLEDAVAALDIPLTPEEITTLEQPYLPHPVAGFA